ncbi:unnamed protein product [Peniophora sp. CBMAI 1063]|nr:unnamed protein product [Peniophora sp. CBMAI 1063]
MAATRLAPDLHFAGVQEHPVSACCIGIRSIPSEVLTLIFIQAYRDHEGTRHRGVVATLTVRRVCKFFRAIADATPELWSYMTTHYPLAFVETALNLSRHHPLSVEINVRDTLFRQISECIRPHWSRCRYLTFDGVDWEGVWPAFVEAPQPGIVTSAPKLTRLLLKSSMLTSNSAILQSAGLTELVLENCHLECDFHTLLQTLGHLPTLTSLSLELNPIDTLQLPQDWDVSHPKAMVSLLSLRELSLSIPFKHALYATINLDIQDICNVSIDAGLWDMGAISAPVLCEGLAAAFPDRLRRMFPDNNPEWGCKELRITINDHDSPMEMFAEVRQSNRDSSEKRFFRLHIDTDYSRFEGYDELGDAFRTIVRWDALRNVDVFRGEGFPKRWGLWTNVLEAFRSVTSIRLDGVVGEFPQLLATISGADFPPSLSEVVLLHNSSIGDANYESLVHGLRRACPPSSHPSQRTLALESGTTIYRDGKVKEEHLVRWETRFECVVSDEPALE